MEDERFAKFATDPKFRTAPKRQKKLKIDPRFQHVFTDERFNNKKIGVDKRGRPKSFASKESYEQYYRVDSSGDSSSDEENTEAPFSAKTLKKKVEKQTEKKKNQDKIKMIEKNARLKESAYQLHKSPENPPKDTETFPQMSKDVDYARGEGYLESESSSEEESSDDEKPKNEYQGFDKWGELDHDAETIRRGDETRRLAVCNLDWDRVSAADIYLALSSFCSDSGTSEQSGIKSVKIYLSDFGRKRLEEEDKLGPEELRKGKKSDALNSSVERAEDSSSSEGSDLEVGDDNYEEKEKSARERVRKYQVNRLRYYYAVAEFSNIDTADSVYKSCDGVEYELSGTKFDLRFIPDDTTFDEQPHDSCVGIPDPETYKPKCFFNTALMQGKVNLTWDETDPEREAAMKRAFDLADNDDDVNAYLAMSSDEEKIDSDEENFKQTGDIHSDGDGDMEMNFKVNDAEIGTESQNQSSIGEVSNNMAPWDRYLLKKKEKQKMKRDARKMANKAQNDNHEADEGNAKMRKRKKKKDTTNEESNEFSLLVMDSDDDKEHFDYKEIVKKETKKSKKRRKQQEKLKNAQEENFKLDLQDNRFSAVFENADFNIDPSHPNFKKTQSMSDMVEEKQRRIKKLSKQKKNNSSIISTSETNESTENQVMCRLYSQSGENGVFQNLFINRVDNASIFSR